MYGTKYRNGSVQEVQIQIKGKWDTHLHNRDTFYPTLTCNLIMAMNKDTGCFEFIMLNVLRL